MVNSNPHAADFAARKNSHANAKTLRDDAIIRQLLILSETATVTPEHYLRALALNDAKWRNSIRVLHSVGSPSYYLTPAVVAPETPVQTPEPEPPMNTQETDVPPVCLMMQVPEERTETHTAPPFVTDFQYMRHAEALGKERAEAYRADELRRQQKAVKGAFYRALAIGQKCAANPERLQMFGANVLPPTIGAY